MITKNHIESILKINGIEPSSPDDVIRSVLLSAKFGKDEVDSALMVLRQNTKTNQTRVDGLHKVFRTDNTLCPNEITQLLGVDVQFNENYESKVHTNHLSIKNYIIVILLALVVAFLGLFGYMYASNIGLFYPDLIL